MYYGKASDLQHALKRTGVIPAGMGCVDLNGTMSQDTGLLTVVKWITGGYHQRTALFEVCFKSAQCSTGIGKVLNNFCGNDYIKCPVEAGGDNVTAYRTVTGLVHAFYARCITIESR